ncbi:hypothetical protein BS78_K313500 [Paspalum vaginatum]|uniref:Uncharacterized protein n=1 Tax=Paspalum vaginatum TaxID=158149 RepID=A0A9W7XDX3_9POAL|nr:hypothetical protein BS78_K313500 [Paspalum vaginatum]
MVQTLHPDLGAVQLHKNVLDGMVAANGLFTAAVLLGVTSTVTPLSSVPTNCIAGDDINHLLVLLEVGSFGCYLLSSLIAQGLKLKIVYYEGIVKKYPDTKETVENVRTFFYISVLFTLLGSSLFLLSIIELIQIKLGLYSCGNPAVVIPAIVIGLLFLFGILVYGAYAYQFLNDVTKRFP